MAAKALRLVLAVGAMLAIGSVGSSRLRGEDREATIQRVKAQIGEMDSRLSDLQAKVDAAKESGRQLATKIQERLESLKTLAKDPASWSDDARRRLEMLKSDDEAKQLQALEGAAKLGDEGLILCAHVIQMIERGSVRSKAIATVCSTGDAGLPVLVKIVESLAAKERLIAAKEIAKNKDKFDSIVFARLATDEVPEIRAIALEAGLSKGNPLQFLAIAAAGNEGQAKSLFDAAKSLQGEDLRILLFAIAKKGPEELLPETVRRAAALGEAGYPIVAVVFHRKTAESRAEIVRLYRKSTKEIEKFAVQEALNDEDATLRAAAEKANREP